MLIDSEEEAHLRETLADEDRAIMAAQSEPVDPIANLRRLLEDGTETDTSGAR